MFDRQTLAGDSTPEWIAPTKKHATTTAAASMASRPAGCLAAGRHSSNVLGFSFQEQWKIGPI